MLAPALPWAALRAPLGVAPGGYAWFPPIALGDRDPARAIDAAWQWIDAHLTLDATVAVVGFSQGGLMAAQLLRTRPERVAATVVLSGFVQAAPQPADEQLAAQCPAVFWGREARAPPLIFNHSHNEYSRIARFGYLIWFRCPNGQLCLAFLSWSASPGSAAPCGAAFTLAVPPGARLTGWGRLL